MNNNEESRDADGEYVNKGRSFILGTNGELVPADQEQPSDELTTVEEGQSVDEQREENTSVDGLADDGEVLDKIGDEQSSEREEENFAVNNQVRFREGFEEPGEQIYSDEEQSFEIGGDNFVVNNQVRFREGFEEPGEQSYGLDPNNPFDQPSRELNVKDLPSVDDTSKSVLSTTNVNPGRFGEGIVNGAITEEDCEESDCEEEEQEALHEVVPEQAREEVEQTCCERLSNLVLPQNNNRRKAPEFSIDSDTTSSIKQPKNNRMHR